MRPILIIEDDPDIAESVRYNLEREGLAARVAETGEKGLAAALNARNPPALVILDLMLPGVSGMELCRRLRREPATRHTPIIMLTARVSEADHVSGFDLGADDYITKPFSVRELMARVRAVLRRVDDNSPARYEDACLTIDYADMHTTCDGENIKLTRKEFALLSMLARSAGRSRPSSLS
jgi:DNA-binding response OmpR family regulator